MIEKIKNKIKNKKQKNMPTEKHLTIKLLICLVYLMVITILMVCSYKLYKEKKVIKSWDKVENLNEYSYIKISKMSEKFAYYQDDNIGIHFVIEKENTGEWHTYLVAINEDNYSKYKDIIDYTYERTKTAPEPIKVYGYPQVINENLKQMAIKNVINFVPAENEVTITNENFESYLTNCYLDTTQEEKDSFSPILCVTLFLLIVMILLFIGTIFDKVRIVDTIDEKYESAKEKSKKKLRLKIFRKK